MYAAVLDEPDVRSDLKGSASDRSCSFKIVYLIETCSTFEFHKDIHE